MRLPRDDWFTCTECVNQRPRIGGDCLESESFRALFVLCLNGEQPPMIDSTTAALQASLRGLASRQRALTDNIANLETPGYLAKRVSFESSLRNAIDTQRPSTMTVSNSRSMDPTGANGNNVNLDDETILSTDTALRYELSIDALNAKYRLLRTAIRGQV